MLVNWKIEYCSEIPKDRQPPDYYLTGEPYWFYRYFIESVDIDVIDIHSFKWLENFEKNILRFYVIQALKAIPKFKQYDLIVSHGMQSGVLVSLSRRIFKTKAKHIVFDIGSFASASESGFALKLMQFASKSIDGVIYHTSSQIDYYKKKFPWIVDKSKFIRFGTDLDFFDAETLKRGKDADSYMICVGYSKRDWDTVVKAYQQMKTNVKLRLVGYVDKKYEGIKGIEQVPFVNIKQLINQIHNAKFCILPLKSYNYSFGQMTLMQQMALGKCVIAARVPSLMDYIEDRKTAITYESLNVKELQNVLNDILNNENYMRNIEENAKQFLLLECNEKIMAKEVEGFFRLFIE